MEVLLVILVNYDVVSCKMNITRHQILFVTLTCKKVLNACFLVVLCFLSIILYCNRSYLLIISALKYVSKSYMRSTFF